MRVFVESHEIKEAAQKSANACGQRVYYWRNRNGSWEIEFEPHPELSTNPFNYCDPQRSAE